MKRLLILGIVIIVIGIGLVIFNSLFYMTSLWPSDINEITIIHYELLITGGAKTWTFTDSESLKEFKRYLSKVKVHYKFGSPAFPLSAIKLSGHKKGISYGLTSETLTDSQGFLNIYRSYQPNKGFKDFLKNIDPILGK